MSPATVLLIFPQLTMASRHEVAIIKTKKKVVMAVREIINVIG